MRIVRILSATVIGPIWWTPGRASVGRRHNRRAGFSPALCCTLMQPVAFGWLCCVRIFARRPDGPKKVPRPVASASGKSGDFGVSSGSGMSRYWRTTIAICSHACMDSRDQRFRRRASGRTAGKCGRRSRLTLRAYAAAEIVEVAFCSHAAREYLGRSFHHAMPSSASQCCSSVSEISVRAAFIGRA